MEKITIQSFEKCPLLKQGFKIIGKVNHYIYISNSNVPAAKAIAQCSKCKFNKNGCIPYANINDPSEIMAKVG